MSDLALLTLGAFLLPFVLFLLTVGISARRKHLHHEKQNRTRGRREPDRPVRPL